MTEAMKKVCKELLNKLAAIQRRATTDHSDGAGMVRGVFGEYLVIGEMQDLIKAILITNPEDPTGRVVEDIIAHQKELRKAMAALTEIHDATVDSLIKVNILRNNLEHFNDSKND